jgi:ATP-dependent helicase HrpB
MTSPARPPSSDPSLPIDAIRGAFFERLAAGPVVVSAPTGSGKSTQIPRWMAGRVLVIEPRRVACRSLAQRVAALEGASLGHEVGYHVRDERRARDDSRILYATPGVALRWVDGLSDFDTIVIDEFHERRLDVDLLLALLQKRRCAKLVVMSATLEGERVADHLGGSHLEGEGRMHPVEVHHVAGDALLPSVRGLEERLLGALAACSEAPGDVLVFLPGKAEIAAAEARLRDRADLEPMPLHGGLSLDAQARVFRPSKRRKVILATNVAETSITVPGVGVVIDSGLVRRTRYHRGRGFLSLVPIADDSAEQRRGRAGRTMPGVCYRLWDSAAKLEAMTPPEMHRESLVPLVLGAAALGERARELAFLDAPREHALEAAEDELRALGALDPEGGLTAAGRELHGLPLDTHLGRLLVEARAQGTLEDAIDLVAVLGVGRPLFAPGPRPTHEEDDLRASGCDATASIRAVRMGDPAVHRLSPFALAEARADARRLRRAFSLQDRVDPDRPVDRPALARTAVAADARAVHVARRRKKHVAFSNGGTEIELARESAAATQENLEALCVLDSRALTDRRGGTRVVATCVMPVSCSWLHSEGLGHDRVASVERREGRLVATIERVYARRVLGQREEEPEGAMARLAIRELFLRGSVFPGALRRSRDHLSRRALASRLSESALGLEIDLGQAVPSPPSLEEWALSRLEELGVESGDDLELLSEDDLVADDVPFEIRHILDREFPRTVDLGDAGYEVRYDLDRRQVVLTMVRGNRKKPPPRSYLPKFHGFRVCIEAGGSMHVLTR